MNNQDKEAFLLAFVKEQIEGKLLNLFYIEFEDSLNKVREEFSVKIDKQSEIEARRVTDIILEKIKEQK